MTEKKLPRGIRNNNPGNIRLTSIAWRGQKKFQLDPDFVEFEAPVMGLRAMMRLLLTYYLRHQLDTVESIINRYAPPHENATDSYAAAVAKALGVRRRDPIDVTQPETLTALARAITRHENGHPPKTHGADWYPAAFYDKAAILALKG